MEPYKRTKTIDFFYKICLIMYLFGLPNCWIEDLRLSKRFVKIYSAFTYFCNVLIFIMIFLEFGAYFTQHNLTEKQKSNLLLYGVSHPMLYMFYHVLAYSKDKVRTAIYNLTVELKRVHNDELVEKQMIKRTVLYLTALNGSCVMAMVLYTFDSCMEVIRKGTTFTSIITAWPDVKDLSPLANIERVVLYLIWWVLVSRVGCLYILVITLVTGLSHQYINLQSYFYSLSDIFDRKDINQREKQAKYEKAFKVGIEFHSDTLRCTYACQSLCGGVFSGQIIFNILIMTVLLAQMVNAERNLVNLFAAVMTASAVLIATGLLMWNSGDVTVEASNLSTAMYFSGWHNCYGESAVSIRKVIVIAMSHAQRPVILKGFGIIDLSYQSYLKIVKSSYSVFSVLY